MSPDLIDLRSDTVTRPTPAMRQAMASAEVGDDVMEIDPSIEALEQRIAHLLGKEAALFMPSGTMTNQVAIRIHCQPGDELVCESSCHIFNKQQGGFAQLSGIVARQVPGENGSLTPEDLQGVLRTNDPHHTRTRLLCLENTHNRAGGAVYPLDKLQAATAWAREHALSTHLDGARLFNAVIATGVPAHTWASPFDTISVCFSKGLGAPVGSALVGTAEMREVAVRHRKLFGGAMRQAGIIAAGALHALDHHIDRLADDHASAAILAAAVQGHDALELSPAGAETNIVIFSVRSTGRTARQFVAELREHGVLMGAVGTYDIRAVTHLDVTADQLTRAATILTQLASSAVPSLASQS
ncbi:MAG: aminotransferase class I/II-fold pyridoxal phosphate-dependent enzyme [Planctomycetales bacterium]|nr:aminotransferase class I/II-fold pyridoxal phosphate-dependent enzyme [Planctomycetales bacterium]